MNDKWQLDYIDIISILSFVVGLQNMQENREQSAHNDVSAANDKQAAFLLEEIGKRLDRQDAALERIERRLSGND
jgi:hypothetical protein